MDMIERVARAMAEATEKALPARVWQSWEEMSVPAKAAYVARARVAIAAMRDPTDDMLDATGGECRKWAPGAWQTMIDAALNPFPLF